MSLDAPILDVRGLRVAFRARGRAVTALRDVSFALHRGRTLALVGESGSGKSVSSLAIMRLLARNGAISGGAIGYRDATGALIDLAQAPEQQMRRIRGAEISMIFQEPM
ncbi:ATP-binding cassette domain-containing protein, partial [Thioclava sp. BHET1]